MDYDFEYTAQFGRFHTGNTSAWGIGYHLGYTFNHARFIPHPELDGSVLSGDHNLRDNAVGTFNPLFPNGNFLSQSILLDPFHLIIVRSTFKTALTLKASTNTSVELQWRQATEDGVYNTADILTHAPGNSAAQFISTQSQQEIDYAFSRHLSGSLAYEHFFAGAFFKQSPPRRSLNFISPQELLRADWIRKQRILSPPLQHWIHCTNYSPLIRPQPTQFAQDPGRGILFFGG